METWYTSGGYRKEIEAVKVVKSTPKTLNILESGWNGGIDYETRRSILSSSECFFRTWEEAHNYILKRAIREVESLRVQLNNANGNLGNIRGMKHP